MSFLKNFLDIFANFLGGSSKGAGGDIGQYYYVKCAKCGEVIRVRINSRYDLWERENPDDGFYVEKLVIGQRCYNKIEATFSYGRNRKLRNVEVSGGTQVQKKEYEQYVAAQPAKSDSSGS